MARFTRTLLATLLTIVAVTWFTATEAIARVAPPEIGPLPPAPVATATAPLTERFTWLAVGAVLGVAAVIVVLAINAIARRHQEQARHATA